MKVRSGAAIVILLLVGILQPSTASAVAPTDRTVAIGHDARGDVRLTGADGLRASARRSVDLRRLRIVDRGDVVRFVVHTGRVVRRQHFLQLFFINLEAPGYHFTQMSVGNQSLIIPADRHGIQHEIVTVGADAPEGYVTCDHLRVSYRHGLRRWWVDVPRRCLPQGLATVSIYAQTATSVDGADNSLQYSWDRLRLGRVDVGGTIEPGI